MASTKKHEGYVITRSKSLTEYFTSSTAYDRPQWVPLSEATVYSTPDIAQQAAKKLWINGSFAAKVQSLNELMGMDIDMGDETEVPVDAAAPADDEMIAAKQASVPGEEDMQGVCPECDCEPCECDDAALADGEPTDQLPGEEMPIGDDLPPEEELHLGGREQEEDSLLGQHLKAAAGMESEETARLHPEEVKMLGKKRMDMKEAEFKMPTRPGNDPAKPDENKTTIPNLPADRVAKEIDLDDPTSKADRPDTDLTNATAHEHEDKVNVPAEIKSQLKAVVDDFNKAAKDNNGVNDTRGSFAMTAAAALQQLHDDLSLGTTAGIKQAQIHMSSYMNPITSHIPADVVNFIVRGGRKTTLKDLFAVKWDKVRGVE